MGHGMVGWFCVGCWLFGHRCLGHWRHVFESAFLFFCYCAILMVGWMGDGVVGRLGGWTMRWSGTWVAGYLGRWIGWMGWVVGLEYAGLWHVGVLLAGLWHWIGLPHHGTLDTGLWTLDTDALWTLAPSGHWLLGLWTLAPWIQDSWILDSPGFLCCPFLKNADCETDRSKSSRLCLDGFEPRRRQHIAIQLWDVSLLHLLLFFDADQLS